MTLQVTAAEFFHGLRFLGHGFELDHGEVAALLEIAFFIEHVSHPAAHACREVAAGIAEYDHRAPGHIFATVVAHTFHHGNGTGIAHGETLTGDTAEIAFAGNRAVQYH